MGSGWGREGFSCSEVVEIVHHDQGLVDLNGPAPIAPYQGLVWTSYHWPNIS